jgi:uncharacterized oligopeptide transporter (OPT) family protein
VLIGSCLGGVLSLTNLYIGLKAGWGFGVAITASILSYAIWTSLLKVGLARTPMTILENNCMQSTASSAGYSTGGTLVSAFAAYIIVNHQSMSVPLMLAWVFFIAVLGVCNRSGAVFLAGARRLSRDGRDRHDAHRRNG